jgi:hypothetical protein
MEQLKNLDTGHELVNFIAKQNWSEVDAETRFVALHEISAAITKRRERAGLESIDDALPGERLTAFQLIKPLLSFP